MKDFAIQILIYLTEIGLGIAVYFFGKWFHTKCDQLKEKVDDEKVKNLIDKLDRIVRLCVESTNQTFVETLKQANDFDAEAQKEAFKKTFESILATLSDEDKDRLSDKFGDLSTLITTSIETYIKDSKEA